MVILKSGAGALLIIVAATVLPGEEGYRYASTIDGNALTLESGPQRLFGNAGGPFLLTMTRKVGGTLRKVIGLHPQAVATEGGDWPKLWGYWRLSDHEGRLFSISLTDGAEAALMINPGDAGTVVGNALYASVFAEGRRIVFTVVRDYRVPELPDGAEWGK